MPPIKNILVIGAGELGTAVLHSLSNHPNHKNNNNITISVLLRPTNISHPTPQKAKQLQSLRDDLAIHPVAGDIVNDSEESLSATFAAFDTIISCTGFVAGRGTQLKITRAVLAAGNVVRYIPWQFGVDYDAIGYGCAQELFDEQLDVRGLLRGQDRVSWVIVSTGLFVSFLFEKAFGVVDLEGGVVRALGGWGNRVTVTAPEDIGRITAEMVFSGLFVNGPVFVAGDTVTYGQLAELVEKLAKKGFEKRVLSVEEAQAALRGDPDNAIYKYQVVFGQGVGVSWDLEGAWNRKVGLSAMTVEEWAERNIF
ncbi:hypothetical protein FQN55_006231 [Onygenales sp. PD_40]|nr:hypothetical protein FQN55_006231 [Onygenales sp. PD_40]